MHNQEQTGLQLQQQASNQEDNEQQMMDSHNASSEMKSANCPQQFEQIAADGSNKQAIFDEMITRLN